MSPVLTDDWWATSEGLVDMTEATAGVELTPKARLALVEMTVELLVLLTCWQGTARPADALGYLRTRRSRMVAHAPWLYALPPSVRRLLIGTDCLPSVLTFVIGGRQVDEALRRAWRRALGALASHVEAAGRTAPELGASPTEHGAPDAARSDRFPGPDEVATTAPVGWGHDGQAREEVQDMGLAPLAWAGAVALPTGALPGIGVLVGFLEGPAPPVGASQLPFATQPSAPAGQLLRLSVDQAGGAEVVPAMAMADGAEPAAGWRAMPLGVAVQAAPGPGLAGGLDYGANWPLSGGTLAGVRAEEEEEVGACGQAVPGGLACPPSGYGFPRGYAVPVGTSPEHATAVAFALAQLGKPYALGATGPEVFDLLGAHRTAWAAADVTLDHYTVDQLGKGERVSPAVAVAGTWCRRRARHRRARPARSFRHLSRLRPGALRPRAEAGVVVQTRPAFVPGGLDGVVDPDPGQ